MWELKKNMLTLNRHVLTYSQKSRGPTKQLRAGLTDNIMSTHVQRAVYFITGAKGGRNSRLPASEVRNPGDNVLGEECSINFSSFA